MIQCEGKRRNMCRRMTAVKIRQTIHGRRTRMKSIKISDFVYMVRLYNYLYSSYIYVLYMYIFKEHTCFMMGGKIGPLI